MYIGMRSCDCLIEEDNYWGSSKYLPEDVSETFDKFILGRFDTREEAIADEIHRHKMNDVGRNPLFINRAKQTSTGFTNIGGYKLPERSKEHCKNISKSKKGVAIFSEEEKQRRSELYTGKGNPRYGVVMTENEKYDLRKSHLNEGRKFIIDGIEYRTLNEAIEKLKLNFNKNQVSSRLKSRKPRWVDWYYLDVGKQEPKILKRPDLVERNKNRGSKNVDD